MIELLQRLFIGHVHHWEVVSRIEAWDQGGDRPKKLIWTQQCSICGKLHNHQILS